MKMTEEGIKSCITKEYEQLQEFETWTTDWYINGKLQPIETDS